MPMLVGGCENVTCAGFGSPVSTLHHVNGVTYSKLINALRNSNIILNRKVLADLAVKDPKAFTAIVQKAIGK